MPVALTIVLVYEVPSLPQENYRVMYFNILFTVKNTYNKSFLYIHTLLIFSCVVNNA